MVVRAASVSDQRGRQPGMVSVDSLLYTESSPKKQVDDAARACVCVLCSRRVQLTVTDVLESVSTKRRLVFPSRLRADGKCHTCPTAVSVVVCPSGSNRGEARHCLFCQIEKRANSLWLELGMRSEDCGRSSRSVSNTECLPVLVFSGSEDSPVRSMNTFARQRKFHSA
ncbi:hypothetical protein BaRGS_00000026 [Batillaria attramentaria]|uniref:Uncharacterized protein n=1 Tax=Batillaria attramentaria TaxID=370345 RepID=A0ABD0M957_9CAEN